MWKELLHERDPSFLFFFMNARWFLPRNRTCFHRKEQIAKQTEIFRTTRSRIEASFRHRRFHEKERRSIHFLFFRRRKRYVSISSGLHREAWIPFFLFFRTRLGRKTRKPHRDRSSSRRGTSTSFRLVVRFEAKHKPMAKEETSRVVSDEERIRQGILSILRKRSIGKTC